VIREEFDGDEVIHNGGEVIHGESDDEGMTLAKVKIRKF
jgi:hypothetical protein